MATRCVIKAVEGGKCVAAGYFHWDGYPEEVLPQLIEARRRAGFDGDSVRVLSFLEVSGKRAEYLQDFEGDFGHVYSYKVSVEDGLTVSVCKGGRVKTYCGAEAVGAAVGQSGLGLELAEQLEAWGVEAYLMGV